MQSIKAFYPQLTVPKKVVITTHQKPDGDAMGSSLALYHFLTDLGHSVTVISPTNWAGFLKWMPGANMVVDFDFSKEVATKLLQESELLFCLDFNILHRTKNMEAVLADLSCTKVLIDHHEQPQEDYFTYGVSNTAKSSTCEMVFDFIVESGFGEKINATIAECLYTGVMTDTGSFRFPSTTANVHRMVARLKDTGFNHTLAHENIYDSFLENRIRFIGYCLLNRMEVLYEYNTAIMSISKNDLLRFYIKTGDTEGLVNQLLTIQGIRLGALVIDRDEERKWSFRSKGDFDVNTFARTHFEGGGHFNAAGGRSSDSLDATVWKFKKVIKQYAEQLQQS
ncbi:DHH family phosphoesterase [Segetibacter koreensis]|uniref:DHH family phosphoesterase n=1 Tax=Segetibacter koreensis TaxID=398037 RepID=UPI000370D2E0|nr:bifunctional oligoribonuclease/PAP phosphatase NrnA [Segetibacter koreensis]